MSILKVARMGHPILRKQAQAVRRAELSSAAVQKLIDDMIETMTEYQGIGLAAPQVHENLRLFVAGIEQGSDPPPPLVVVNPELTLGDGEQVEDWEGCLSIPDVRGRVPRAPQISLRALDRHGVRLELAADGFAARVIQHEADHLDGILFPDRMRSLESLTFLDEYARHWGGDH